MLLVKHLQSRDNYHVASKNYTKEPPRRWKFLDKLLTFVGKQNIKQKPHNFISVLFPFKIQPFCLLHWIRKTVKTEEILTINIKPGWKKGTKITFPEKGNEEPDIIPSDLVFVIDEKPHSVFTRDGNDLIVTQKISLAEALTGCSVHLTTLDGRNLSFPITNVITPNYEEVIPSEGMPLQKDPIKKGNLRIKFDIKFPTRLTPEQKAGIRKLLGQTWAK